MLWKNCERKGSRFTPLSIHSLKITFVGVFPTVNAYIFRQFNLPSIVLIIFFKDCAIILYFSPSELQKNPLCKCPTVKRKNTNNPPLPFRQFNLKPKWVGKCSGHFARMIYSSPRDHLSGLPQTISHSRSAAVHADKSARSVSTNLEPNWGEAAARCRLIFRAIEV